jgi:hypothetical protein
MMIDTEPTDTLVERLREFPNRLRSMIQGVSDQRLKRAAAGGGWGPVEMFCHLRDIDELLRGRVERILAEDDPFIPAVDETLWPIERDYSSQNPHIALEQFAENRAQFTRLLESLSPEQWLRSGHHAELGEQSVLWNAQDADKHDAVHAAQLERVLREP